MAADDTVLAIRGQAPKSVRATQTQKLTKGKVKARGPGTMSRQGKLNPEAFRPGMHSPSGPQPFISKGRIGSPETVSGKLNSDQLKAHATSSNGSFGVSFSSMAGTGSSGYTSQASFNKTEFDKIQGKSFITTTNVGRMQENPHSSILETELVGRGHVHADDAAMMQHTLFKNDDGGFNLRSSQWQVGNADQDAGWGKAGTTATFDTFDEAFERMYRRGVAGVTHFED